MISADLEAAGRCHYLSVKAARPEQQQLPEPSPRALKVNLTGVDTKYDPDSSEDEDDDEMARELKKKIKCLEPHKEFLEIPFSEDPTKTVKLGADLTDSVKESLIVCLRRNAKLFSWSAVDMPGIPLEVACHQLSVNPEAKYAAQRQRVQSGEKAEAASKAVADLISARFEKEVKYKMWLSNVVLVKKNNVK